MNFRQKAYFWQGAIAASILLFPHAASGQITPDGSVGTTVTPNVEIKGVGSDRIEGGSIRGSNLFHSFSEFNIQNGRGAYFTNPEGITNIFSRITGNNPSNINGILGVLGNANLFLLNPNGIIFGPNARLDLNGSFIGTTANSFNFADGTQFSATNPQAGSLLTVSVPIGLGFGSNPGAIRVQGTGHRLGALRLLNEPFPAFQRETNPKALTVQPGRTLALVGGDINIQGGQLVAQQGRIELLSVGASQVNLNFTSGGLTLSDAGVTDFRDIQLSQRALLDASESNRSGGIHISGRQIRVTEGSVGLVQNLTSSVPTGDITVNASELLQFAGTTADGRTRSHFMSETIASGNGGEIRVSTKDLIFQDGGQIATRTFGAGASGNVTINASNSVQALGVSSLNPRLPSGIFIGSNIVASGKGGDLTISTRELTAANGAFIATISYGVGAGGNLRLNASVVDIFGTDSVFNSGTDLRVGSTGRGNSGNSTINTQRLTVRQGGRVSAATLGSGNAGSITINAAEFVEVNGGTIRSSGSFPDLRSIANGIDTTPTGLAGGVNINTSHLVVQNSGTVTVANSGPADGGRLEVNAGSIVLDNRGSLTATTALGSGGDIILQTGSLQMRHNSAITSTAGGTGNGGNLTINSDVIAALENSDITANAFQGQGGNIAIATQNIFNSTNSDITASSQLGISGTVNISTLNVDQHNVVAPPPSNFVSTDQVVASSCLTRQGSSQGILAIAGNGGLPETPETGTLPYEVVQVQSAPTRSAPSSVQPSPATTSWKWGDPIVEATEFSVNAQGQVVLIAKGNSAAGAILHPQPLSCQSN